MVSATAAGPAWEGKLSVDHTAYDYYPSDPTPDEFIVCLTLQTAASIAARLSGLLGDLSTHPDGRPLYHDDRLG